MCLTKKGARSLRARMSQCIEEDQMSTMFSWREVNPAPGEPVAPDERLPWGKTVGLGAQHVVAMFGATFVFPLVMGLDPNLAIMFSGICTILFLLVTDRKSTRLNSSHPSISYAVFCLKK